SLFSRAHSSWRSQRDRRWKLSSASPQASQQDQPRAYPGPRVQGRGTPQTREQTHGISKRPPQNQTTVDRHAATTGKKLNCLHPLCCKSIHFARGKTAEILQIANWCCRALLHSRQCRFDLLPVRL